MKKEKLILRQNIIKLHKKYKKQSEISYLLDVPQTTVSFWIRRYNQTNTFDDKKRPGKKSKLTNEQIQNLKQVLLDFPPSRYGGKSMGWLTRIAIQYVYDTYGVKYSMRRMQELFHKIGLSLITPRSEHSKASFAARTVYRMDFKKKLEKEYLDCIIVNFDEVSFRLVPFARRVWAPRGSKPKGIFWWSNKKANMFGALINGKELHHEWYDKLNATSFIEFMTRFMSMLDKNKKYVFVFDNGPAHKAKKSQEFLTNLGKNIHIEFLPTYSPQLNCIETCWKIIRYNVTNSNWFQSIVDLKGGIEMFLDGYFFALNPSNYLSR